MAATTMMFGPEWMRTKQTPRTANPPSPPPLSAQTPGTPAEKMGDASLNPYAYSKEEMLRIYKEGGGRGGLGLEVERWEGVVRQVGSEPAALKEPTEAERKLFAGPLNSELRRRQSTEQFSPLTVGIGGVKPNGVGAGSPMRERFSNIARRRDSSDTGPMNLPIPRKLSLSGAQLGSPRESAMPSPRTRGPLTPGGIDGVLSGGDSWMARRRASEAGKALPTPRGEDGGGEKIAEEDETGPDTSDNWRAKAPRTGADADDPTPAVAKPSVATGMAGLSLKDDNQPVTNGGSAPAKPPGLPLDVAAIEWQYLDPQGNIQGPFRADVMSQWHIQGYFTMDLLMRRKSIDTEWTQFGLLVQRLGTQNVFLTPFDPIQPTPPGLPQQPDPSQQQHATNNLGAAPYQPVPQRQSQVAALEAYYNPSPASHSPASSFGGGRLGNNSPEVFGRGGVTDSPRGPRAVFAQDGGLGRRQPSFVPEPGYEQSLDPVFGGANRFGQPVRTASTDGYAIGSTAGFAAATPWGAQNGLNIRTNSLDSYGQQQQPFGGHGHLNDAASGFAHSPLARTPGTGIAAPTDPFLPREVGRPSPAPFDAAPQQFTQSPSLGFAQAQGTPIQSHAQAQARSVASQGSQWVQQPQQQQPKLFDPSTTFPTARNTISLRDRDSWAAPAPVAPSHSQAQTQQSTQTQDGKSPWTNTAQNVVEEGWREVQGPNSLTVSNLGQHNLLQQKEEAAAKAAAASALAVVETPSIEKPAPELPVSVPEPTPKQVEKETVKEKEEKKETAKSKKKASAAPVPVLESVVEPSPSTPVDAPKVWASGAAGEEKKMTLREIQEAETRRLEERKAAERERRLMQQTAPSAQTTSAVDAGELQQISWGLPTSKVGAASTAKPSSPVKEIKDQGKDAVQPVWGTNGAGKKKSMKEIQEEEERRKAKEARDAAARSKMYAETTTKSTPSPAPAVGGAWTTVGAPVAAKTVATAASMTARPSPAPAAVARKPAATPAPVSAPSPAVAKPVATPKPAPAPKVEVAPAAPSAEFMKWLSDNLKALSNGVEYDAIVSMLLSFPLDVDPSTSELISDLIYANSATLDGRRFAAEFASRRKADAMRKSTGGGGGGPASIADIVKSTPKSAGNEWGGFKVVNKKKKGGRA